MITITRKDRFYRGELIQACFASDWRTHGGRWVVRSEWNGMPRFEDQCPHYPTLAVARAAIAEFHRLHQPHPGPPTPLAES